MEKDYTVALFIKAPMLPKKKGEWREIEFSLKKTGFGVETYTEHTGSSFFSGPDSEYTEAIKELMLDVIKQYLEK